MDNYTTEEQRKAFLAEVIDFLKNNPSQAGEVLTVSADKVERGNVADFIKRTQEAYKDVSLEEILNQAAINAGEKISGPKLKDFIQRTQEAYQGVSLQEVLKQAFANAENNSAAQAFLQRVQEAYQDVNLQEVLKKVSDNPQIGAYDVVSPAKKIDIAAMRDKAFGNDSNAHGNNKKPD
jgi:hypothetical protein